jgi:hypothetical protein
MCLSLTQKRVPANILSFVVGIIFSVLIFQSSTGIPRLNLKTLSYYTSIKNQALQTLLNNKTYLF